MLSTTQTLTCPTCGRPAIVHIHTQRRRRSAERDAFEPQLTFVCRGRCALSTDQIRTLCSMDALAG